VNPGRFIKRKRIQAALRMSNLATQLISLAYQSNNSAAVRLMVSTANKPAEADLL